MNVRNLVLLFLLSVCFTSVKAGNCLLSPVSLQERVNGASSIFEGSVVSQSSFEDKTRKSIFTSNIVEVFKVFKGHATLTTIELITSGGKVGDKIEVVEPALQLKVGETGVFFCQSSSVHGMNSSISAFEVYADPQGFIQYNMSEATANDPFNTYNDIPELLKAIEKFSGNSKTEVKSFNVQADVHLNKAGSLIISSFSPTVLTAGNSDILTIKGKGFGATYVAKQSVVFVPNADGGTVLDSIPVQDYISWNDSVIKVYIPEQGGSGKFKVVNSAGDNATSTQGIIVKFNLINLGITVGSKYYDVVPRYIGQSAAKGFDFKYNQGFSVKAAPVAVIERSLQNWRCGTLANYGISAVTTSIAVAADDATNVISFDSAFSLPTGVLGRTHSHYRVCTSGKVVVFVVDVDLIFSTKYTWNFNPGYPAKTAFDFQSVVTHELGHSFQLGHVVDTSKVMNWNIGAGMARRAVDTAGSVPGVAVLLPPSLVAGACTGMPAMTKLSAGICSITNPNAKFGADDMMGCVPFKVNFIDSSQNNPTSWKWDVDGDGNFDYTAQNPSHTYTKTGTYTITLTASNNKGNGVLTKTAFITVFPSLSSDAGLDGTICKGSPFTLGGTPAASGGKKPYKYLWIPSSNLSSSTIANPVSKPTSSTTYNLKTTDSVGCIAFDSIRVNLNSPIVVNAGRDTMICEGKSFTLGGATSVSGGKTPYVLTWTPSATLSSASATNPTATPKSTTWYKLTVSDGYSCTASDSMKTDVTPKLSVGFKDSSNLLQLGVKSTGIGAANYKWKFGDGSISNASSASHTYTKDGAYTVTLIVSNACFTDSVSKTINVKSVGISGQSELEKSVSVYPNPGNTSIYIEREDVKGGYTLNIMDIQGRTVLSSGLIKEKTYKIERNNLPSGIYFLQIRLEDGNAIRKKISFE